MVQVVYLALSAWCLYVYDVMEGIVPYEFVHANFYLTVPECGMY
jgi:hypothetical protein